MKLQKIITVYPIIHMEGRVSIYLLKDGIFFNFNMFTNGERFNTMNRRDTAHVIVSKRNKVVIQTYNDKVSQFQ